MVEKKPGKSAEIAQTEPYAAAPTLLSGGNPQIAKGYGDGPVQAYIAAMPCRVGKVRSERVSMR